MQTAAYEEHELNWPDVVSLFRVLAAHDVLAMEQMKRYQNLKDKMHWLGPEEQPLVLLFISHRWETLEHPDPTGRQFKIIQEFLRRICICVEAMLVPARERLQLVPSLSFEGTLQAEEVVRRMLGSGPFAGTSACIGGQEAKRIVKERFRTDGHDRNAFHAWLASKIAVWLDYTCMPQKPLSQEDEPVFRRSLLALDSLVMSSTVLALRQTADDYPMRGWCASEFFLASTRSFSRGLFFDMRRMEGAEKVLIPDPPALRSTAADPATKIMTQSYAQDLSAFHESCSRWSSFEGPLLDMALPDPWSSYRALQGSSFLAIDCDPNPFRRVLEAIRSIETALIEKWLMSEQPRTFDIGKDVGNLLQRSGLRCSDPSDLVYLGYLLACHGWIETFKPLFRGCLRRYVENVGEQPSRSAPGSLPIMAVTLKPLDANLQALFMNVTPHSAGTWNLRLSSLHGSNPHESAVIEQVRKGLNERPPEFLFVSPADQQHEGGIEDLT